MRITAEEGLLCVARLSLQAHTSSLMYPAVIRGGAILLTFWTQLELAVGIQEAVYHLVPGVNAHFKSPVSEVAIESFVRCAALCMSTIASTRFHLGSPQQPELHGLRDGGLERKERLPVGRQSLRIGSSHRACFRCLLQRNVELVRMTKFWTPDVTGGYEYAMATGKLHFLKAFNQTKYYANALTDCKADGGLPAMDNRGSAWHQFLLDYAASHFGPSYTRFWLGLTSPGGVSSKFTWLDGTPMNQTFWGPKNPNNLADNHFLVVEMVNIADVAAGVWWNGLWNDGWGEFYLPYLCEKRIP
ncbi:unnamed protein product [Darwinula stevensoni]|uniref:C-type lectin domain-containing protein n=1 Tax=Darwinula stevensoni TaxID=69355 RepID=A0A7R8XAC7_9CRUS|nr:unnamed protein product [Darwinula stevensoni]CAG0890538.1 unnamed protein product [Darwinula stevensoni]